MFKKITYLIITLSSFLSISSLYATSIQDSMKPWKTSDGVVNDLLAETTDEKWIDSISKWIVDSIDFLLPITAVGVFLFVGIRLAVARWNPEEFKKAWMQFMYAVIWIFAISFAWAAVKLVWGLSI